MSPMRNQLLAAVAGAVAAGILALIIAALVIANGWFDVSASKGHGLLVTWLLHTTMIRSVRARAGAAPIPFSPQQVEDGFRMYDAHCVMCHGAPGVARPEWVKGLTPPPPYLMDAARRWSPGELRFIVSNGIKMTAMPAWKFSRSEEQLSGLVAFLEKLPDLSPAQYARMRAALRANRPVPSP